MRTVLDAFSNLTTLFCKLTPQIQRDVTEVLRLRKGRARPASYVANTLDIVYKIIDRYTKETPLPYTFMTREDWENFSDKKYPYYTCIVELYGVDNLVRGLPLYCLTFSVYHYERHVYTIVYEAGNVVYGVDANTGEGYVLGGGKIAAIEVPSDEDPVCVWSTRPVLPCCVDMAHYVIPNSSVLGICWVVRSRVAAAVVGAEDIPPCMQPFLKIAGASSITKDGYTIFGLPSFVDELSKKMDKNDS